MARPTPARPVPAALRGAWTLARATRVYQWAKNALVFVPLLTAHRFDLDALASVCIAFVALSLAASSIYLINDVVDLEDDRRHPLKRHRALASGDMPVAIGVALVPLLLAGAGVAAFTLPVEFRICVAIYVATSVAYSFALKKLVLVDVFCLAALYTLRILAGAAAITVPVSDWLLVFSIFAFVSIALAKRYVEVDNTAARAEASVGGRGYAAQDGQLLLVLGVSTACLASLVFALYLTSEQVIHLYSRPRWLWLAMPLLLHWLARLWLLAHRRALHEDPLLFALRDPTSYVTVALVIAVMIAAT